VSPSDCTARTERDARPRWWDHRAMVNRRGGTPTASIRPRFWRRRESPAGPALFRPDVDPHAVQAPNACEAAWSRPSSSGSPAGAATNAAAAEGLVTRAWPTSAIRSIRHVREVDDRVQRLRKMSRRG
jgi:hypothetical protein